MSERKGEIPIKDTRWSFDRYWTTSREKNRGKLSKKAWKIALI